MAPSAEFLRSVPYFAHLTPTELRHVAERMVERSYDQGALVFVEGEPCEGIHFVKSGRVKVFKTSQEGREQVLLIATPGQSFNDVPVFDGGPNPASTQTLEDTTLYLLRKADMMELLRQCPTLATGVIRVLASRLRHLTVMVEDLSFRHVTARVAKILLQHADTPATERSGSRRLTQQEMAAMVGTAREVVGRSLKALERAGALRIERGRIVILNRNALERIAGL